MKKLTKAMAISLLASTVAISTVGCRYTVEVKDNEASTKQEQQLQPTANDKSENESTKTEKENTTKENTRKEAEKTNKKDVKSSSHKTTKGESKKDAEDNEYPGDNYHKNICAICGKNLPSDDAVFIGDMMGNGYGFAHGDCLNNYYKETGKGDWDDSPTEPEEPDTNVKDDGSDYSGNTSHDEPDSSSYDVPDDGSTYAE